MPPRRWNDPQSWPRLVQAAALHLVWAWAGLGADPPPPQQLSLPERPSQSLSQAAVDLSAVTRVEITVPAELGQRRVAARPAGEVKFWEAVQQLAAAGNANWDWGADRRIHLLPRPADDPVGLACVTDCLLVRADARVRAAGADRQLLRINLRVDAEPSRFPLFGEVRDREVTVTLGGKLLVPFTPDAARTLRFDGQQAQVALDDVLSSGVGAGARVDITGKFQLRIAASREALLFPLGGAIGAARQAGQTKYILAGWQAAGDALQIELAVQRAEALTWESHQLALLHREAWLEHRDGRKLKPTGIEVALAAGGEQILYRFPIPPGQLAEWQLRAIAPLNIIDATVPFSLPGVAVEE